MKVMYRSNGEIAELSDYAARTLAEAGICDIVTPESEPDTLPKRRKAR